MSFANFGALLWLIPLAGIIIVLYLLKMRRKDVRVPATFLWPAMIYEIRANALFQKLKFSWLMVLQLLALACIVFALSRPQFRQRGLGGAVTVLVIDSSASMQASDVRPSRFEEAKRIAGTIVDSARPGDKLAIVEAGPSPRVASPLSSDPPRLRRALQGITATDAEAEVGEALRLAASITAKQQGARIVLLSDGVFTEVTNFSPGDAELVFRKIGVSGENVAITALGAADTAKGREVYCGLKNFGTKDAAGVLTLQADGKTFDSLKIEKIAAGQTHGESFKVPPAAKVVEARFDIDDGLEADDYAIALTDPGASIRTLLITRGNLFLERALALDPRIVLDKAASVPSSGEWDLVVFDGVEETEVAAKAVLTLGSAGSASPVSITGTLGKPSFGSVDEHPISKAVGFDGVFVETAQKVRPKAESEVLAEFQGGAPLLVASRAGGKRRVYLAFEPLQSDFPLQVGFPIFLANAVDWMIPPATRGTALSVNAGRTFSIPATSTNPLEISGPTLKKSIPPINGSYVVRDLKSVGKYRVGSRDVYTSLRSDTESNISPADRVLMGGKALASSGSVLRLADLWRPLALLALLVLAGEWWLFARRS